MTGVRAAATTRACRDRSPRTQQAPPPASIADWTAGYEAGWSAGYLAAREALDAAGSFLADTLRPSRALEVSTARSALAQPGRRPGEPDFHDPAAVAAHRAAIYASWGLPCPAVTAAGGTAPTGSEEAPA
ncbi:hypothetical protein [Kineosporia sp. A_224]|uniref:hypothetical protein n=1 Tax=Kineosporia sp. A_224 TaxID=1962180 RepID=UPI00130472EF|nr:hypothetical protein [Kineosporia sp. A_224]